MKLSLSGIAAAVMLAVLPAAQAADSGQGSGGRHARQHQRVDQGASQRVQPAQLARADNSWNRGRGNTASTATADNNTVAQSAGRGHWNHGGHRVERPVAASGLHHGRHLGWDNRHHGWYDNRGHRYHGGHASINQREAFQRDRIVQAQRSGQLTRSESQALWAEQRAIEAAERNYRSDGRFTREERADIQRRLDMSRQHIYQESHDAERRF